MDAFQKFKSWMKKKTFHELSCQYYSNEQKLRNENSRVLIPSKYWDKNILVNNQACRHKDVERKEDITQCNLKLCTTLRWIITYTPRLFHPREKILQYPPYKRTHGGQSRSGCYGKETNYISLLPIKPYFADLAIWNRQYSH